MTVAMERGSLCLTPSSILAGVVLAPVDHGLAPVSLETVLAVTAGVSVRVLSAGATVTACVVGAGGHLGLAVCAGVAVLATAGEVVDPVNTLATVQA